MKVDVLRGGPGPCSGSARHLVWPYRMLTRPGRRADGDGYGEAAQASAAPAACCGCVREPDYHSHQAWFGRTVTPILETVKEFDRDLKRIEKRRGAQIGKLKKDIELLRNRTL
jgi:hypothetical protein